MEYVRKVDLTELNTSHERWTQDLLDGGVTDSCSVKIIKTPAGGGSPAGLHTHQVDQIFYVLSGTMNVEIYGTPYVAGPGTLVVFPAGVAHRNWNSGDEATVHLAIAAPRPPSDAPFAMPVTS
jgi:quercetin dioxygenase-like cupin family protein